MLDQKYKKKWSNTKIFLILSCFLVLMIGFLSSPVFHMKDIKIEGNHYVTSEEIRSLLEISENSNIFTIGNYRSNKILTKNPYVEQVKILKKYPSQVTILIKERTCRAYVEYKQMGTYILIDEKGMVLGTETHALENKPVVVGLDFSNYIVGQTLKTQNTDSFKNVVLLSQLFLKYNMSDVVRVDVNDEKNIKLYIGHVIVEFGDISDADEKIKIIIECMNSPEMKDAKGTLDISSSRNEYIFKQFK